MIFQHSLHVELWTWLSEHPEAGKSDWPRWWWNEGDIASVECRCFACGYAIGIFDDMCSNCPLVWPGGRCVSTRADGLFDKWASTHDSAKRSKLALEIAQLPVKKGVETDGSRR